VPIRLRLAAAFALAAAALFALGGWLFAAGLSSAQLRTLDSQLTAQLAQAGHYLPAAGGGTASTGSAGSVLLPGDYVVQVLDAAGHVRGGSGDAGTAPLVTGDRLSRARHGRIAVTGTVDEEGARIAAAPLDGHQGWVAVAAVSLETYESTQSQVARELAVGGAVFVAVAGLGAYGLARAALSPVERLRRQVAAVSERGGGPGPAGAAPGAACAAVEVPSTRDEIAALAGTMNELLGRLQRALARQRAFVADASHELRNPLAVLQGELELAARPGRSPAELTAAVGSAHAEAERLARLTADLLLLARSDEDRLSLRPERADVGALLGRSAEQAGSRLAAAGVSCRVEVRPGTYARVDADRIRQAVDNLIGNALRFAPRGTVIVLAARAAGTDLDIEVRDEGPGFPAGFLPHAFERFARPDTGRSRGDGGAGLGLAIVRAVAAAHGGVATAANRPGGGAVVRLHLPGAVEPS
jgi:two-component system, OmpR family, sensor kinase